MQKDFTQYKPQGAPRTTREPNRHGVFKKNYTNNKIIIPKTGYNIPATKPKQPVFYKQQPNKPSINIVDGKRVFRWSFSFSYPNMKPVVYKIFIENQHESTEINFVAGPIYHDRDFKLIAYTTTQEKAEKMIMKELKKLIAIGKIRSC